MAMVSSLFALPDCIATVWDITSPQISLVGLTDNRKIKEALRPRLEKTGIRPDLQFFEKYVPGFCSATGTNTFSKSGSVFVMLPRDFYTVDQEACIWVLLHEIAHIRNNDSLTIGCAPFAAQLVAAICGMYFFSSLPALGLAFMAGAVAQRLFPKWREARADDFAIANSSEAELLGGRRFLMACKELGSVGGDTHPSVSSRIEKIEEALNCRGIKIDVAEERERIHRLAQFISITHQPLEV